MVHSVIFNRIVKNRPEIGAVTLPGHQPGFYGKQRYVHDIVHTVLGVHKKRVYDVHQIEHCVLTIIMYMHAPVPCPLGLHAPVYLKAGIFNKGF